ncbi:MULTISPECIES: DNA-processing protein DprA [Bacteria]
METIESLASDERSARIALAVAVEPGEGTTATVMAAVGAQETLRLLTSTEAVPGVDVETAALWRDLAAPRLRPQAIHHVLDATRRFGLHVSIPGDPEWPEGFAIGGVTPPLALWILGEVDTLRTPVQRLVTLTGSRAASSYGEFVAAELATGAAERGGIVVGGGAYGIEAAAHRGALNAGGKTIAVHAGGLDRPYPAGNQQLFERIAANGALLSEIPPGCAPTRLRFVQRARLLAALSDTSVIVEAGVRSGSLLVAARAAAFGRDVGAVPGPITSASSSGPHELLCSGTARIITGAHDIQVPEPPAARGLDAPGVQTSRTELTVETVRSYEPNLGSREGGAAPAAEDWSSSVPRSPASEVAAPRL